MSITWMEQADNSGCGLACLGMLMDTTYARIKDQYETFCEKCGIEHDAMDQFLAESGYAIQRIWKRREFDGAVRKWPPKPWAERHLVMVTQTKQDHDAHYVVMDRKGNVYDPADPEYKKCRLSRYYEVEWVAAVIPCTEPKKDLHP